MASLNEVEQSFRHLNVTVTLGLEDVWFHDPEDESRSYVLRPSTTEDAHTYALMLRRAARRLEGIGESLKAAR